MNHHTKKEAAFWSQKMGLKAYEVGSFEKYEVALQQWISSPQYLDVIKKEINTSKLSEEETTGLEGWLRFFQVNAMNDANAIELQKELIGLEGDLGRKRGNMELGYKDPVTDKFIPSGYAALGLTMRTSKDEKMRKAAWEGMSAIGPFVLENGFIEIIKKRNRLAKTLGYKDYYDYKVQLNEGFSKDKLFEILDDLEEKTRLACEKSLETVAEEHGAEANAPWNFSFYTSGDLTEKLDPYFSFDQALQRWGASFSALGIRYNNAEIQLDLVNRKGKYENGFMHGPFPSYTQNGKLQKIGINFTANAIPGKMGSGKVALTTLFHEGGHAAHFANIKMPAPCFSQEFAPTSVAFAETQSMFLDSLVGDADWMHKYAINDEEETIPFSLIEECLVTQHRFQAKYLRQLLVVSYTEKALYEMNEEELTSSNILSTVAKIEKKLTGQSASPRPTLSIPHLLSGEASAYYHGYTLAQMAVYQTRAFFLKKYGYLTDNSLIGPQLAEKYWLKGNAKTFLDFIEDMTGEPFSANATAELVNLSIDDLITKAKASIERITKQGPKEQDIDLDIDIKMVHGDEVITTNQDQSFEAMAKHYSGWIQSQAQL